MICSGTIPLNAPRPQPPQEAHLDLEPLENPLETQLVSEGYQDKGPIRFDFEIVKEDHREPDKPKPSNQRITPTVANSYECHPSNTAGQRDVTVNLGKGIDAVSPVCMSVRDDED